jgi:hypothetical protein
MFKVFQRVKEGGLGRPYGGHLKAPWVLLVLLLVLSSVSLQWAGAEDDEEPAPKPKKKTQVVPLLNDPRGAVDLTLCSQNLKMFGTFDTMMIGGQKLSRDDYEEKVNDLVARFASVHCDVIAAQEVMGRTEAMAKEALGVLATRLREVSNRSYQVRVAPPAEGGMTVGFLIAENRAEILNTVAYGKVELPKLSPKQKPRLFTRSPLELQISVTSKESTAKKTITVVNFHFKSKRGAVGDPSGLEWETYRMEMSEALRRIVERRLKQAFASGESLLVLMGDRNSNFDVGSARILDGTITLKSFQDTPQCRLTKRGAPICRAGESYPQRLFSVLTGNPRVKSLPGTFEYKGEYSWLDEITMPAESLPFAWHTATSEGVYDSGAVYKPKGASDHAMVYVRLNW